MEGASGLDGKRWCRAGVGFVCVIGELGGGVVHILKSPSRKDTLRGRGSLVISS